MLMCACVCVCACVWQDYVRNNFSKVAAFVAGKEASGSGVFATPRKERDRKTPLKPTMIPPFLLAPDDNGGGGEGAGGGSGKSPLDLTCDKVFFLFCN